MIKSIEIKNMFAIKDFNVDFKLVNNRTEPTTSNQIIKDGKDKIAMIPTFLAKNASGKTSFIKSIEFALRFAKKESFIEEMLFYKWRQIRERDAKFNKMSETDEYRFKIDNSAGIVKNLFKEISFVGSEFSNIFIEFTKNRFIKIEISDHSFLVLLKDTRIDVLKFLDLINLNFSLDELTNSEIRKKLKEKIEDVIHNKKYLFYDDFEYNSLITGGARLATLNEVFAKHIVMEYLENIIANFGFESLKTILKKIDTNIKNITHDVENKTFDLYVTSSILPISPYQLSLGTQKAIEIISKSINIFEKGGVIMIDEIENGLHLSLIQLIVSIFEDEDINKNKAQIILTTHNPLIIDRGIVKIDNVFMYEQKNFIQLKNLKTFKRTEDKMASIKPKNYFNDYFWMLKSNDDLFEPKSTISQTGIEQIIITISKFYNRNLSSEKT